MVKGPRTSPFPPANPPGGHIHLELETPRTHSLIKSPLALQLSTHGYIKDISKALVYQIPMRLNKKNQVKVGHPDEGGVRTHYPLKGAPTDISHYIEFLGHSTCGREPPATRTHAGRGKEVGALEKLLGERHT